MVIQDKENPLLCQPFEHHHGNIPTNGQSFIPTTLVIWGCIMDVLLVMTFQIFSKQKDGTRISLFVSYLTVTNTILMLYGPVQDIYAFQLKPFSEEYTESKYCTYTSYFLYVSVNYTVWIVLAWLFQTITRVVSPNNEAYSLPKDALFRLAAVFTLQSVFLFFTLNYFSSINDRHSCLNHILILEDKNVILFYFLIILGIPTLAYLTLGVFILIQMRKIKLRAFDRSDGAVNYQYKAVRNLAVILSLSSLFLIALVVPAIIYIESLSRDFEQVTEMTDPGPTKNMLGLLNYKYVLANLVMFSNALLHLILHAFIKDKFLFEMKELFPCLYGSSEKSDNCVHS